MDLPNAPSSSVYQNKKSDKPNKKDSFKSRQIDGITSGASSTGPFLVVCALCSVCVVACVYSCWREAQLENRLNILQERVASLEKRNFENVNVLVERIRRETEEHFKNRIVREVLVAHKRTTRDAPECICPAGKKLTALPIYRPFNFYLKELSDVLLGPVFQPRLIIEPTLSFILQIKRLKRRIRGQSTQTREKKTLIYILAVMSLPEYFKGPL